MARIHPADVHGRWLPSLGGGAEAATARQTLVVVIYGDAPVCDFKSWPGGKGEGEGRPGDGLQLLKCYGFQDGAEALAYRGNPVDTLEPLARAGIALIHVVVV